MGRNTPKTWGGRRRTAASACIRKMREPCSSWSSPMGGRTRASSSPIDPGERGRGSVRAGERVGLFAVESLTGGTPVVLLHGFGQNHTVWQPVLERLAGLRSTIAYDLPGHGRSLREPHGSAAVAARAVLADLSERGAARAHLVGHSLGGAAATLVAL